MNRNSAVDPGFDGIYASLTNHQYSKRARTGITPTKIHESRQTSTAKEVKIYKTKSAMSNPHANRHTNDEIHATIDFCPVLSALIDTPPFQRLRDLKQLGTAQYVYCNANHTRFEHSLGVAHLAEKVMENIFKHQYHVKENTTPKDVLCVKVAGLFHDIGHGPFSHTYEDFVHSVLPEYLETLPHDKLTASTQIRDWTHEMSSLDMIDMSLEHLGLKIDATKLDEPLVQIGDGIDARSMRCFVAQPEGIPQPEDMILTSRDFIFIKECIVGGPLKGFETLIGRPHRHHEWLYDIVCNRHSGLDVDKIDYFARDVRRCFGESGEVDKVFIKEARVCWGKCTKVGEDCRCRLQTLNTGHHLMICYPEKTVNAALVFFKRRFELHEKIYQHKTVLSAGLLICDIFCKAELHFEIPEDSNYKAQDPQHEPAPIQDAEQRLTLSTAMLRPEVYVKLRDSIIDIIEFTPKPELAEAQALIARLRAHDFYKLASRRTLDSRNAANDIVWLRKESTIKEEIISISQSFDSDQPLTMEDFVIKKGSIHYGQKQKNPLLNMRFFRREDKSLLEKPIDSLPTASTIPEHTYRAKLPTSFMEQYICAFSRCTSKLEAVAHAFDTWWEDNVGSLVIEAMETYSDEDGRVPAISQESVFDDESVCY